MGWLDLLYVVCLGAVEVYLLGKHLTLSCTELVKSIPMHHGAYHDAVFLP